MNHNDLYFALYKLWRANGKTIYKGSNKRKRGSKEPTLFWNSKELGTYIASIHGNYTEEDKALLASVRAKMAEGTELDKRMERKDA